MLVDVVCPQCTTIVRAQPGAYANCPNCGYAGGSVPGDNEVQVFTPPHEFLPSDPFPQEKDQDEDEGEQAPPKETSRVALTAMILGFSSIIIPIFASPVAVGFGIAGLVHVGKNPDEFKGKGLAIIGIVFGVLTSIVWVVILVSLFAVGGRLTTGR